VTQTATITIATSMLALAVVSAIWAHRIGTWRPLLFAIIGLGVFTLFLNRLFGFPTTTVSSMGFEDVALWTALYLCMLAGMFAQYAYRHFDRAKRKRLKWDWGLFLAPAFASPLVFIPLATSYSSLGLDFSGPNAAKFMIYLVAFQNGFFWKEYFDLKRREAAGEP
jgi:hypothetical protein